MPSDPMSARERERDVLSRLEADERSRRVRDVAYAIELDLAQVDEGYLGRTTVTFDLDDASQPLFLDFSGQVTGMRVNDEPVDPDQHAHRLLIEPGRLRRHNVVVVDYANVFDRSGDGFHRFVDPEDGEVYVYSNLEPFSAHRLFPCFDQPDLKATYDLRLVTPRDWLAISAQAAGRPEVLAGHRLRHVFRSTPRFSTYLLSVIAGPWEGMHRTHDGIPLGLFARRSMRRELERSADELFEITAQGIDEFRTLFGQPYPFAKYDQVFAPEFNAGAMENVAAVTFHDSFLFRDPPTYGERLYRGEVVLHELAHMWFGDLVTMRWWDDLWLNETFATYLSYRCLAAATRFEDAWLAFSGQMRPAAYRQDQLPTTHAVATAVTDTDEAIGNFDAITYEKGAAVIKQLVAAIGDDAFRDGLRTYFERHAWSNATLADLLAALGEAAGVSLDAWSRVWLEEPSLNTLGATWTCRDRRVTALSVGQSAPADHPTLRPHATRVALVAEPPGGGPLAIASLPIQVGGRRTAVLDAIGLAEPVLVYPNHGDHDYALISLDPASLAFALERLPEIPEALLRQQLWSTLWQMVRDAELSVPAYLDAIRRNAPVERDRGLVQSLVGHAATALGRFVPPDRAAAESAALVRTALEAMGATDEDDLRLVWARAAISMASRPEDIEHLLGLVDGRSSGSGFPVDQEMRWSLAVKAVAHALDGAEARLSAEADRDPSDRGQRWQVRARASRPDPDTKRSTWDDIHGAGFGSDYLTRSAMAGFQWSHQRELLLAYREPFFERAEQVYATRDHAFAERYVGSLVPDRWAEPAVIDRIGTLRDGLDDRAVLLRRQLDEIADDLARAIRVQAHAMATV